MMQPQLRFSTEGHRNKYRREDVLDWGGSDYKETIMHGHDRHNTSILTIIHNMSTTCFGQYYFDHHQVGYNYRRKLHNI